MSGVAIDSIENACSVKSTQSVFMRCKACSWMAASEGQGSNAKLGRQHCAHSGHVVEVTHTQVNLYERKAPSRTFTIRRKESR